VDDYAAAVRAAVAAAGMLGIDPARIAVGGDSAGGNLAAVAALMARDGDLPPIAFQLLLYPVTDMAQDGVSYARFTAELPLTSGGMRWFRAHYAPDPASWEDWRASPLRAGTLAGTAPAFVLTVGHDPLCDEGRAYALRLEQAGVPVTHLHVADLLHGALTMAAVVRPAMDVIADAGRALRRALAP
jgi:acetyl esterase